MKLLILGGTVFLGRHLVQAAEKQGHQITIFTRGTHNPDLFPEVEKVRGDRDGGLAALPDRSWDAVIDTCGYVPRVVRQSVELLKKKTERYVFISSISVYRDFKIRGIDEDYPVAVLHDPTVEKVDGESYGGLKALCEQAVVKEMREKALIVRPGLIVGPHDPSDRFTYWPRRVARGGEVLAPGKPEKATQVIDVRDLSDWILRMTEEGETGVYNATGPERPLAFGDILEDSRKVAGSDASFTWVSEQFLLEQRVAPWSEIPLWLPEEPEHAGFDAVRTVRALNRGLSFRPIEETIADTLRWDQSLPEDRQLGAGLSAKREAELLRLWREGPGAARP